MSATYPNWMMYLQIANFLLTWGTAAYVYWNRKRSAETKRLAAIEARLQKVEGAIKNPPALDGLEKRLIAIELALKNPTVCSNHNRMEDNDRHINARLDGIKAGLDKIDGRLEGINRMVDLLTQNELNGGK